MQCFFCSTHAPNCNAMHSLSDTSESGAHMRPLLGKVSMQSRTSSRLNRRASFRDTTTSKHVPKPALTRSNSMGRLTKKPEVPKRPVWPEKSRADEHVPVKQVEETRNPIRAADVVDTMPIVSSLSGTKPKSNKTHQIISLYRADEAPAKPEYADE